MVLSDDLQLFECVRWCQSERRNIDGIRVIRSSQDGLLEFHFISGNSNDGSEDGSELEDVQDVDDVGSTWLLEPDKLHGLLLLLNVVCGILQASPLLGVSEPAVLTWSTEMWMI